jgi:hypothetical protein
VEVDRIAADVGSAFAQSLSPSYNSELPKSLRAISTADVVRESARLDERRLVVVIVGDESSIRAPLEAAGFSVTNASADLIR